MSTLGLTATVSGANELGRRLATSKDPVRESIKRAMRRFGREMVAAEKVLAPRNKGYQSPGSKKVGPLSKSIYAKLRAANRDRSISIDIRPTPFYALFVEGGVTRQRFRKNHLNVAGEAGKYREVVIGRGYMGKNPETRARMYRGYYTVGKHQRQTVIRDEYGASIGTKFQTVAARTVKPYKWKKVTHIAGRPFVQPVWNAMKGGIPDWIRDAVREGLEAAGVA